MEVLTVLSYHAIFAPFLHVALQQLYNREKDSGSQPEVINHILHIFDREKLLF